MATETIRQVKPGYNITSAGTYSLGSCVAPVRTTGSGNYFDFFLPIHIADGLSVTAITVASSSALLLGSDVIYSSSFGTPLLDSATQTELGLLFECKFKTTQSSNCGGAMAISNLTIIVE